MLQVIPSLSGLEKYAPESSPLSELKPFKCTDMSPLKESEETVYGFLLFTRCVMSSTFSREGPARTRKEGISR